MMYLKFAVIMSVLVLAGACGQAANLESQPAEVNAEQIDVLYTLKPMPASDGQSVLEVMLEFTGDDDGETELRLGAPWADQRRPERRFRALKVSGGELLLGDREDRVAPPHIKKIKHAPGASLRITYRLREQDNPERLNNSGYFYSPVISPDHMQLIGWTGLAVPRLDARLDGRTIKHKLVWSDLPDSWESLASRTLNGAASIAGRPAMASVTLAGEIERKTRRVGNKTLSVARYGDWSFSHDAFADRLQTIMTALNETWQDAPADYAVSLLPVPVDGSSSTITGTGLEGAFAAASSQNLGLDEMSVVLTHEIAHNWLPAKLGKFPDERAEAVYWFSEGFTEFSARTVMREAGLMSQETYVEKVNEDLQEYYLSPARNAKVDALIDGFWNDPDIERQPYLRGFFLALGWETEIRVHSEGASDMSDALRALKAKAKAEAAEEFPTLTPDYLSAHFSEWTGRDVSSDITRYINEGKTIVPSTDDVGVCYELENVPISKYDVGFDVVATFTDGIIKGVVSGSTAEEAGLEDGMQLRARVSGGQGDTSGPITLELSEGERIFQISYLPISGAPVIVPQFKAKQNAVGC